MKYILYIFLFTISLGFAQDKLPFADEVLEIQKKYNNQLDSSRETIVFTGSSSIRMWHDLSKKFPKHQIVNSGFGGSKAYDLLIHHKELILDFKPKKVFIYEGDNDISGKVKSKVILENILKIIQKIQEKDATTEIVLISVKPSISRWKLRGKYKRLNRKFKALAKTNATISFIDVWNPMLKGRKLDKDLFISDGLHMNYRGYDIWYSAIKPFMQ